jgi:hypothetical protein
VVGRPALRRRARSRAWSLVQKTAAWILTGDVQEFFDRWITQIPTQFSAADRATDYWWELSMRQVEVSHTLVLDDPRRARRFFEALSPTTSASAAPTRSTRCSAVTGGAGPPPASSGPGSSGPAPT